MNKWNEPKYKNANVTIVLRECLDSNGLKIEDIGDTHITNHIKKNGNIATSAIDHIYHRTENLEKIIFKKISNCSSDHLPIIATIPIPKNKLTYIRKIKKRSYKNFTQERWIDELKKKDWFKVEKEVNINNKTAMYTKLVTEALDICNAELTVKFDTHTHT